MAKSPMAGTSPGAAATAVAAGAGAGSSGALIKFAKDCVAGTLGEQG